MTYKGNLNSATVEKSGKSTVGSGQRRREENGIPKGS